MSIGTLRLGEPAPYGGVAVGFSSRNQRTAHLQRAVFIAWGRTAGQFVVRTMHVGATKQVTITAGQGIGSIAADLTANPY
jgi:hypothetical protein